MADDESKKKAGGSGISGFLARWAILGIAVMVTGLVVPGVSYDGFLPLLVASLLLGILNAFVKPVLVLLTLPVTVLTLGLFLLIINAALLLMVGALVDGFDVASFGSAAVGAILISLVAGATHLLTGVDRR